MSIAVKCACGKTLKVKDTIAGKKGKCPACGGIVLIPSLAAQEAEKRTFEMAAEETPTEQLLCPACKSPMPAVELNRCPECGVALEGGGLRKEKNPKLKSSVKAILEMAFAGVFVAGFLGFLFFISTYFFVNTQGYTKGPIIGDAGEVRWTSTGPDETKHLRIFLWGFRIGCLFLIVGLLMSLEKFRQAQTVGDKSVLGTLLGLGAQAVVVLGAWLWWPSSVRGGGEWSLTTTAFKTPKSVIPWKEVDQVNLWHYFELRPATLGFTGTKFFELKFKDKTGKETRVGAPIGMRTYEVRPRGEVSLRWPEVEHAERNRKLWVETIKKLAPHVTLTQEARVRFIGDFAGLHENVQKTDVLYSAATDEK